jgi:hypothetical protein
MRDLSLERCKNKLNFQPKTKSDTVASESFRTTSFLGITFLGVNIFPSNFYGFYTI